MIDFILASEIFNVDLLAASIRLSTPIALAAIGATVCEKSGVVNIAMEGIMIVGAFFALWISYLTGNPWIGLLAGIVFGGLYSLIHAWATVSLHLDHTVSGAVLNILAFGLTRYMMVLAYGHPGTSDTIMLTLADYRFAVPLLSKIPILGPALFDQTPIVYFMYIAVIFFTWFMKKTKVGLHIKAAGEHPLALETIGVSVYKIRYLGVVISGLLGGVGRCIPLHREPGDLHRGYDQWSRVHRHGCDDLRRMDTDRVVRRSALLRVRRCVPVEASGLREPLGTGRAVYHHTICGYRGCCSGIGQEIKGS